MITISKIEYQSKVAKHENTVLVKMPQIIIIINNSNDCDNNEIIYSKWMDGLGILPQVVQQMEPTAPSAHLVIWIRRAA